MNEILGKNQAVKQLLELSEADMPNKEYPHQGALQYSAEWMLFILDNALGLGVIALIILAWITWITPR